ncbi:uncharacterized protein A4U43_C05F35660 [Asparagus officinalis]|uniref:Terpene cyclase/mutase family member n=1 Tax=Asparagus officinalis TaxID=4686 RepID=A0A5P1EXI6_ASPOF|nr:uncharacterized protein A4U43_C05F35660 [Asparagus officinalis]
MWKLNIGEGGPCLKSRYDFIGRQVWEFDPKLGSLEEREAVERARQEFRRHRFQKKQASDLLMRMQFAKENNHDDTNLPQVKLKEDQEISEEAVRTTLRRAIGYFSTIQAHDGHWPADFPGPLFLTPTLVIALYVTGAVNSAFSAEHQEELCRYIYNHQNEDGGWGFHTEGLSVMFSTALCYTALRLLGEEVDYNEDGAMVKGRNWIHDHGGVTAIPTWGKMWLSEDLYYPHPLAQDVLWECLHRIGEPLLRRWPLCKLRERALQAIMEYIHYEDENSVYICVGAAQKVLCMLCCWVEDPSSDSFKLHLARIPDYLWTAEDGMKMQILENPSGDFRRRHRHISKGGWAFTIPDHGWPVSDCTAEALKAALLLSRISPNIVGQPMATEQLNNALNIILSLQNRNGGFSTWELTRTYQWIEFFNASEFFADIVLEYQYVECTSSAIQALALFKEIYPGYRTEEVESCIQRGMKFIENKQEDDGSWYGSWGICYTYGTWFGVEGLVASGKTYDTSSSIRRACHFLLSKQLASGGWGESYLSSKNKVYTNLDGNCSHLVNTAWAMLALVKSGQVARDPAPLHRAAKFLINTQQENGDFPQQEMLGSLGKNGVLNYASYRNIFPIWALGEYRKHLLWNSNTSAVDNIRV